MPRSILPVFMLLCCLAGAAGCAPAERTVMRMSDRQMVGFSRMIDDAAGADVIFVSETHDNYRHHANELEIVRALRARKVPLAIGLELFQVGSQRALDDWSEGRLSEQEFLPYYYRNWSYDWSLYRDIFIFARDHRIPMVALNIPEETVFKVARSGFASLSDEEKRNLPAGVTCDLTSPQTELLRGMFQAVSRHGTGGKVFTYFCEAQTVRNSGMALNLARYARQNPGRKVVVLAGNWHAVRHGIPDRLEGIGGLTYRVLFSEISDMRAMHASFDAIDYLIGGR